jgi:hypothetical protein
MDRRRLRCTVANKEGETMKSALLRAIACMVTLTVSPAPGHSAGPALTNQITRCKEIRYSGSYALTRNLFATGDCIVVATNRPVTIDLGGWTIFGSDFTGSGIVAEGGFKQSITVRNGAITGFEYGILLEGVTVVVENVRISNGAVGIVVGGRSTVVDSIVAGSLAAIGISVGGGSIVRGNIVGATDIGIVASDRSIVSGNVVNGDLGITVRATSIVSGNTVRGTEFGIAADVGSTVSGNTVINSEEDLTNALSVRCPSNVIGNTLTTGRKNLIGDGCTDIDNLGP